MRNEAPVRLDGVCIGMKKARTTWVAREIARHPDIAVSDPKEPRFLNSITGGLFPAANEEHLDSWTRYASCFRGGADARRVDFTTALFNDPAGPATLQSLYPALRAVVLLREPVARARSHYLHAANRSRQPVSFDEALANEDFAKQIPIAPDLARWMDALGDRLLVVTDVALDDDPEGQIRRIAAHWGADPGRMPPVDASPQNERHARRGLAARARRTSMWLRRRGLAPVLAVPRALGITRLIEWADRRDPGEQRIPEAALDRMRRQMAADIDAVEALLGEDLSRWRASA